MFINILDVITEIPSPTISVEHVTGFSDSTECALLETGLEWLGYSIHKEVLFAPDFGGLTGRKRTYLFATTLPTAFAFPAVDSYKTNAWDAVIADNLHHMKKVGSEATINEGIKKGRDRFYFAGGLTFPTITKSNFRYTKDTSYFSSEDGYFIPDAELSKKLMGIEDFDLSTLGNEGLAVEVIGQSIDGPMHTKLATKIKEHILSYAQYMNSPRPVKRPVEQGTNQLAMAF
jgi:DNA (cytosine-5)-methyltransferase 1